MLDRRTSVLLTEGVGFAGDAVREVVVLREFGNLLHDLVHAGHQAEDGDEEEKAAGEATEHDGGRVAQGIQGGKLTDRASRHASGGHAAGPPRPYDEQAAVAASRRSP